MHRRSAGAGARRSCCCGKAELDSTGAALYDLRVRFPRIQRLLAAVSCATLVASCSILVPPFNPVITEDRTVTALADPAATVTMKEARIWFDGPAYRRTRGIRLPQGVYALEGEDAEYYYFRAPSLLELRPIENEQTLDGPDMPGGLALRKTISMKGFAAIYVGDGPQKMLVWRFGSELVHQRGRLWDTSFGAFYSRP
jgi:hypothetical protein